MKKISIKMIKYGQLIDKQVYYVQELDNILLDKFKDIIDVRNNINRYKSEQDTKFVLNIEDIEVEKNFVLYNKLRIEEQYYRDILDREKKIRKLHDKMRKKDML